MILEARSSCEMTVITRELKLITINCSIITTLAGKLSARKIKQNLYLLVLFASTTGYPNKKFLMTPGSILSQSQAFSTESNQSQSYIHVNIMVPGVTGNFLLGVVCMLGKLF